MATRGVIYVATGRKYVDEATRSIASLKRFMPDIHATIFTDLGVESESFDRVLNIDKSGDGKRDKITSMSQTPYDQTLYLDSDTYICGEISELFDLLDAFDVATTPDVNWNYYPIADVPFCYPELNTGVVLYKQSVEMTRFFDAWLKHYEDYARKEPKGRDQPSFRTALYHSRLRFAALPYEYNCRWQERGVLVYTAKILHGRAGDARHFETVAGALNRRIVRRVYIGRKVYGEFKRGRLTRRLEARLIASFRDPPWKIGLRRLVKSLRQRGIRGTLNRTREEMAKYRRSGQWVS